MKYLAIREFDKLTSALNCNTGYSRLDGGCDLYTTKGAKGDKKLYKDINSSLEEEHKKVLQATASISPSSLASYGVDLSRNSPFGLLSQPSSRRTFAYLVATLNASHPDHDFTNIVRPIDFTKRDDLVALMREFNDTMHGVRPYPPDALLAPPPGKGAKNMDYACRTPGGTAAWSPNMWKAIDKEMKLTACDIYEYLPDEDPFDDHALWSHHYFFFSSAKTRKRVCYLYVRAKATGGHSPVPSPTPKRGRPVSQSWSIPDSGANKRAKFWFGEQADELEDCVRELDDVHADNEAYDDEAAFNTGGYSSNDEPLYVNYESSDDDELEHVFREKSAVRGMSEHIVETMDL